MASPWKSHVGLPFGEMPDASLFEGEAAAEARVHGWIVIDEGVRHSGDLMRPLHRRCVVVKRPDFDPDKQYIRMTAKSRVSWEVHFGTSDSVEFERFLEWEDRDVDPSAMPNSLRPSAPGELLAVARRIIDVADASDPTKQPSEYAIGWAKCVLSHFEQPVPYGPIDLGNLEGRERVIFQLGWYLGDLAAEREIRLFWDDAPANSKKVLKQRANSKKAGDKHGQTVKEQATAWWPAGQKWAQKIVDEWPTQKTFNRKAVASKMEKDWAKRPFSEGPSRVDDEDLSRRVLRKGLKRENFVFRTSRWSVAQHACSTALAS